MSSETALSRLTGRIERLGNALPHPFWIFVGFTIALAVLSAAGAALEGAVRHPATGEVQPIRSLFSREGLGWLLANALENVARFRPLSLVLTMLVGIGLAERTGFFEAAIRRLMTGVPPAFVPAMVVFAGILANIASDVSYLIMPPLGAAVFAAAGRAPLAGFCAALAGTGAGYTANLLIAGTDVLSAGITTQAAQIIQPQLVVSPLCNWYFMSASAFLLTAIGAGLTTRWLEPGLAPTARETLSPPAPDPVARRALRHAWLAGGGYALSIAALTVPERGWLHAAPGGDFEHSPFMLGIVPLLSLGFGVLGTTYGVATGAIRRAADVPRLIGEAAREMSGFFVVAVAIAQFLACFQWTNAGVFLAVHGADAARGAGFTGLPLLFAIALITAVLSLFVASSSALWSLLAPIFVPMCMLLGFHPAAPQVAFRIAESATNTITPMTAYLVVLVPQLQRLRPQAGLGTLIALMAPYSAAFFIGWLALLAAWYFAGWPLGPGAPLRPFAP
ncbi:MAG: AbgT family transporter [Verrucomicrobia bacterium]|nr:AbgT family transporter [Verrucomicrobiota bacterium]